MNENTIKKAIIRSVKTNRELGSSTLTVLYLDKTTNCLYSGYLGDSCYMIARPNTKGHFEVIFKAEEQTHGFNIPFQVGKEGDNPNTAITNKHLVKKDDIVIVASDGLWDNVEVEDIVNEINQISEEIRSVKIDALYTAKRLSEKAEKLSLNPNHYSPFARRAYEQFSKRYRGGKPDDITIVVAQVGDKEDDLDKSFLTGDTNDMSSVGEESNL